MHDGWHRYAWIHSKLERERGEEREKGMMQMRREVMKKGPPGRTGVTNHQKDGATLKYYVAK